MNYTISIVLIAISFFLSVFYTSPLFGDINIVSAEKDSLNKSLGDSKGLRTIVAEKEALYNNLKDTDGFNKINKLLPDSIDNVKLIIDIDDIASKYNFKIKNIDIKVEQPGDLGGDVNKAYGTAMLRFSVSAPYDSFKLFLKDLEDSSRLVDISSLTFSAGDKSVDEYNIELKTYWLKETI